MSRLFALLTGFGLLFLSAANSDADLFSSAVNLYGSGTSSHTQKYLELSGSGNPYSFSFTQEMTFTASAVELTTAQLILTYRSDSDNPGEQWWLYAGSTCLGQLGNSTKSDDWVEQVFTLPRELYSQVPGETWSLQLTLRETTPGTDKLQIARSVLSGTYTPVPLPVPILLFGSGFSALICLRKKILR